MSGSFLQQRRGTSPIFRLGRLKQVGEAKFVYPYILDPYRNILFPHFRERSPTFLKLSLDI